MNNFTAMNLHAKMDLHAVKYCVRRALGNGQPILSMLGQHALTNKDSYFYLCCEVWTLEGESKVWWLEDLLQPANSPYSSSIHTKQIRVQTYTTNQHTNTQATYIPCQKTSTVTNLQRGTLRRSTIQDRKSPQIWQAMMLFGAQLGNNFNNYGFLWVTFLIRPLETCRYEFCEVSSCVLENHLKVRHNHPYIGVANGGAGGTHALTKR